QVADDPVDAAITLAAGPASAPRDVVLATKATMRTTASPGAVEGEQHEFAKRTELGPQAATVESPEFASRLAAARRR
ncbi:MAG: enoyl-CoA hydratase, partial [Actinomycetota bacterium]|nr:enoyl-CoA hydratase [Actinomycetota bacterium]